MSDTTIVTKLVLVFAITLMVFALLVIILGDVSWCVDNYALDRVPHCLYHENNLFGKFIQP
jgi:hypothetical protein